MKKLNKKVIFILIAVLCLIAIFSSHVLADVGSFESYDSGGSWGGSSWDSGSSWGSSSWDSDYSSGGNFIFFGGPGSFWVWLIVIIIITIINILKRKYGQQRSNRPNPYIQQTQNYQMITMKQLDERQIQIENRIQAHDENFNKEEFVAWSKNLFIKLQQAWTARDWSTIRTFETENLFEQHKNQLQGYINNNQINVMDRICVNYAHLYNYRIEGDKEILTVRLNSRMTDYIINATTNQVLRGDKSTELVNTYLLTFIRKNGVKTKPGTADVNTTNCPNCGAPTQITSSGKCEYCGSVVTTGEYSWALSNLERENYRQ